MSSFLVPMDEYGIFADKSETARANSLLVAKMFNKRHDIVLRDIRKLDCSDSFRLLNFVESSYKNEQNKKQPCVDMTRDGFMFLVMGYRGKTAAAIKEAYINRFNEMEVFIKEFTECRREFPEFTNQIKRLYPDNIHAYSTEINMLNKIVLGMNSKQYRKAHEIPNTEPIRSHFTATEIERINELQKLDTGLMLSEPDYHKRKGILIAYYTEKYAVV